MAESNVEGRNQKLSPLCCVCVAYVDSGTGSPKPAPAESIVFIYT